MRLNACWREDFGAMTDFEPTAHEADPLHSLISWPAVIAGMVVAVAVGAMLDLLGSALGAGTLSPFDPAAAGARAFGVGSGLWMVLANILALFAGGFVASRAAKYPDRHEGMLHGLTVWALAFIVVVLAAGVMAGGPPAVPGPDVAEAAASGPDATAQSGALQSDGSIAPPDAAAAPASPPAPVARVAAPQKDPATGVALWSFLTMLLGAGAAVFGGRYGARQHGWERRAARIDPTDPHPPLRL